MTIFLSITTLIFISATAYFAYRAYVVAGLLADEQEYSENLELTNQYMYGKIVETYETMQQVDRLGAFEKDDEAGTTFQLLQRVITDLKDEFNNGQESEEK